MNKNQKFLKCGLYALGTHAILNFLWTSFLTSGTKMAAEAADNTNNTVESLLTAEGVSQVLDRLLSSQLYIAVFSAIFGFSFLLFGLKNMSNPAKYSLHIILNYVATLFCAFMLLKAGSENGAANGFVAVLFLVSIVYFVLYGLGAWITYLIRKKAK